MPDAYTMLAVSVVLSHVSLQAAALAMYCCAGLTSVSPAHLDTPVPQAALQLLRTRPLLSLQTQILVPLQLPALYPWTTLYTPG